MQNENWWYFVILFSIIFLILLYLPEVVHFSNIFVIVESTYLFDT